LPAGPDTLARLAERLYEQPSLSAAADLLATCLGHADELVRVAAAASYFELSVETRRLLRVLARGTRSNEELVRGVAATALARIAPEHRRLRELTSGTAPAQVSEPAHTSLLVHGTFARNNVWWQPGGDFHEYLRSHVRPDLYGAPDRFAWSGGYSDAARLLGASDLRTWLDYRGLSRPDFFTHSHGGGLAMLASQAGLDIGSLVMLSCPVHPHKYQPDFGRVGKVVSIRVRLDLVILADRGGQRFQHPQVEEHVLPIWFDHFATHYPQVWQAHNVPTML
jgi:pimeloyl-ACP methyl ester carboxylesterase